MSVHRLHWMVGDVLGCGLTSWYYTMTPYFYAIPRSSCHITLTNNNIEPCSLLCISSKLASLGTTRTSAILLSMPSADPLFTNRARFPITTDSRFIIGPVTTDGTLGTASQILVTSAHCPASFRTIHPLVKVTPGIRHDIRAKVSGEDVTLCSFKGESALLDLKIKMTGVTESLRYS